MLSVNRRKEMNPKMRQYANELAGALAIYAALLIASIYLTRTLHPGGLARYAIVLAPMLGIVGCVWAIIRQLRRLDELQRRVQLEGLAISFAVSAFGSLAWGFAESAGAPQLPTFLIWPIMAALWVVGGFIAHRRYR
jgi:uncharacterized membrane protein YoaT (DUF817 family)